MSYEYVIHMDSMPSSMELKHLFSTEEFIVIDSGSTYLSIARTEYAGQSQKWGGEIHIEWEPGALFVTINTGNPQNLLNALISKLKQFCLAIKIEEL